jgi:hypothetical protein
MNKQLLGLVFGMMLFVSPAIAQDAKTVYGKPSASTIHYFNPILPDFVADPSVVMFNGRFYLYGTTDVNKGLAQMGAPVVWVSDDFVNWRFEGTLIQGIDWDKPYDYTDAKGKERKGYFRYWAPGKPVEKDGKYYLFPTIVKPDESMGTYVMVADKPEGPFVFLNGDGLYFNEPEKTAAEAKPIIPDIDGEPFVDDDGQMYIYWRRRFAAKMKADFSALEGETVSIPTTFGGYSEGPVMFKRSGIYYYIYTLSGNANYCNGYMMSRQSALGPFERPTGKGIFVWSDLEKSVWGPGHGNVFQMPGTDDYYFLYLEYGEGGTTRQVFVNKMEFNADGTIQPMKLHFNGVGHLNQAQTKVGRAPLMAVATASSVMPEKSVTAIIAPDPNALKNFKVTVENGQEVARLFNYSAQNAVDGMNGTCWRATADDASPWFTVDLQKKLTIDEVQMAFTAPTYGHAWVLEKSTDGKKWTVCAKQSERQVCSPHTVKAIGKARFLRLSITQGEPGLWEFKVFGK